MNARAATDTGPSTRDTTPRASMAARARSSDVLGAITRPPLRRAVGPVRSGSRLQGGRFVVGSLLGSGAMGAVYAATDTRDGIDVALKLLRCADGSAIYFLKQEFRTLAGLAHPNLVRVHELFCEDDLWFFSMERLQGVPLLDRLGHRASVRSIRAAFAQLAAGVSALHGAGRVHRDLKPANVLWTLGDRVVVLDLGLTSEGRAGGIGQTLSLVSGTPAYMAPEQAAALPATFASDWYAVGAMLYEALCGRLPHEGLPERLLAQKQSVDPPPPSSFGTEVDLQLEALAMALLARDPERRPTAEQVRAALEAPVEHASAHAPDDTPSGIVRVEDGLTRGLREAIACTEAGEALVATAPADAAERCRHDIASAVSGEALVVLTARASPREHVYMRMLDGIVDALSRYLRQLPDAEAAALLPRHVRCLIELFPVMERVPCVHGARQRSRPPGDEGERVVRGAGALRELLSRLAEQQPLVLVVEGAEHADPASVAVMAELLAPPDAPPLLLLLAHADPWGRHASALRERIAGDRVTTRVLGGQA